MSAFISFFIISAQMLLTAGKKKRAQGPLNSDRFSDFFLLLAGSIITPSSFLKAEPIKLFIY